MTGSSLFTTRTFRQSLAQSAVVAVVGVGLGVIVLATLRLESRLIPLMFLAALSPFVCMMAGGVRKLMLALILLDIPLQMDIYLGYDDSLAKYGAIIGFNLSVATVALIVLYGEWVLNALARRNERSPSGVDVFKAVLPLALYVGCAALSLAVARDAMRVAYELWLLLQSLLLFIYIVCRVRTSDEVILILTMLLIGLALEGAIMIAVRATGQGFKLGALNARIDDGFLGPRVGGTIGSPNNAAGYLSLLIAPALGVLLSPLSRRLKLLATVALTLGLVGLVLTFSRGGWTTFILSVSVFLLLASYRRWLPPRTLLLVFIVLGVILLFFQDSIIARLTSDDRGAALARIPLDQIALKIIQDFPIFGVGLNNFDRVLKDYLTPDFKNEWIYTVHNKYLLVWSETGIVGLVAFLLFIAATLWRGWHAWRLNDRLLAPIALGLFAGVFGQLSHMAVDIFNGRAQVQSLWVVAALIVVTLRLSAEAKREEMTR